MFYFHTWMLILILIDVQYLQNVVISIKEGSNGQNQSDCHHPIKKFPQHKIPHCPTLEGIPLLCHVIWKILNCEVSS